MVAVAGDTGKLYYANAGTWNRLATFDDIPTSANGYGRIQVDGQTTLTADSPNDTMTLIAGVGMTITTNATTNTITLTSEGGSGGGGITAEDAQDAAASLFLSGTHNGITFSYNDASNSINATVTASAGIYTDEQARDAAGSLFTTGSHSGISFVYDDDNDRINASVTFPTPYSDENAQDAAASMIVNGSHTGIGFTYQDASNRIDAAVSAEYVQDQAASLFTSGTHSGISFSYDDNNNRMNVSVSATGVTQFSNLTDASSASLTIDKIYLPAITMLAVSNNSALAYRFDQYGPTTDNPTLYVISGTTIAFNLNVSGHPFLIQTNLGANYNTGLVHVSTNGVVSTGAAAQGQQSGTLYWKVPHNISGNYKYVCSIHGVMTGVISVKDIASV
jgi:plastocyanin